MAKIQVRRDTTAAWTSANPILAVGEFGYETDGSKRLKIGDGSTAWGALAAIAAPAPTPAPPPAVTAPTIATQPSAQSVTAPSTATFTVVANANGGTLTYQWRKGGVAISGATSASYTTPATSTNDNGSSFDVVVSNTAGSVTSSAATLTVSAGSVAPGAVTGVTAGTATSSTQPLTWTASTSGTAPIVYAVGYRLTSAGGAYTTAATGITGTSYTVTGLSASTAYDYQVTPSNTVGAGTAGTLSNASTAAGSGPDTRPGWFAAPSNAATSGTAAYITGRTVLANGVNGGRTGSAVLTTAGANYAWFAIANATAPTFTDSSGFQGGFTLVGSPFVDLNSTSWYLYKSDYPGQYTASTITLS